MSALDRIGRVALRDAARRLGGPRGDWARAMEAEMDSCPSAAARWRWALGCWVASLRAPARAGGATYPLSLVAGMALMAAHEWRADEGPATFVLLGLTTLALGLLRPRRAILSGLCVGLVVAAVLAFEVLSGHRPGYETRPQGWAQTLHWAALVAPALAAAWAGRALGRLLPAASVPDR